MPENEPKRAALSVLFFPEAEGRKRRAEKEAKRLFKEVLDWLYKYPRKVVILAENQYITPLEQKA